ncbi:hypothetical protein CC78DRAFT_584177 [Lojkania enalia]|uniref:Uncharacterized protein n=1 Tax=Lojkania enalia TaxID=147567 RepID=A0A9P4K2J4_9PLEO|nr:hypothetical protein CC78DRAFT_584177 [Didymosphaeria enalia]
MRNLPEHAWQLAGPWNRTIFCLPVLPVPTLSTPTVSSLPTSYADTPRPGGEKTSSSVRSTHVAHCTRPLLLLPELFPDAPAPSAAAAAAAAAPAPAPAPTPHITNPSAVSAVLSIISPKEEPDAAMASPELYSRATKRLALTSHVAKKRPLPPA